MDTAFWHLIEFAIYNFSQYGNLSSALIQWITAKFLKHDELTNSVMLLETGKNTLFKETEHQQRSLYFKGMTLRED